MSISQDDFGAPTVVAERATGGAERASAERSATTGEAPPWTYAEPPVPTGSRTKLGPAHPALTAVAVVVGCYLLLAAILIGSGLAFTHFLTHSPIGHWDDHVNDWFAGQRTSTGNRISSWFTALANTPGVVVVAAAITVLLLIRRWGKAALLLVIGLAVELAVFLSTTYLVARPRPSAPHLGSTPSTFSWPSGHTAATLVLYGGIALLVTQATPKRLPRIVAWVVAVALTLGVALSRIYRGEHHPIDTMAGAVLGAGALCAAVWALRAAGASPPDRKQSDRKQSEPAPDGPPPAAVGAQSRPESRTAHS